TPASPLAIVAGKWGAVASVGMLIAVLSCLSFLPAQSLMRSETLAALFRFGWREAALFLALLLPLAAMLSALMMAIAVRCRTIKEAQASNTVVILVASLLPMVTLFTDSGEQPWHLWTPALAMATTPRDSWIQSHAMPACPELAGAAHTVWPAVREIWSPGLVTRVSRCRNCSGSSFSSCHNSVGQARTVQGGHVWDLDCMIVW